METRATIFSKPVRDFMRVAWRGKVGYLERRNSGPPGGNNTKNNTKT